MGDNVRSFRDTQEELWTLLIPCVFKGRYFCITINTGSIWQVGTGPGEGRNGTELKEKETSSQQRDFPDFGTTCLARCGGHQNCYTVDTCAQEPEGCGRHKTSSPFRICGMAPVWDLQCTESVCSCQREQTWRAETPRGMYRDFCYCVDSVWGFVQLSCSSSWRNGFNRWGMVCYYFSGTAPPNVPS